MRIPRHADDSDDSGTSAIELAILAPLLLLLIFGLVQLALWAYGRSVALQAAQQGVAKIRIIDPTTTGAGGAVDQAVLTTRDYAGSIGGQGLLGPAVARPVYATDSGTQRTRVTVTVTGHVISLIPGWQFTISRSASGELELFRSAA